MVFGEFPACWTAIWCHQGMYERDQRSSSHLRIKIRPHATMQALLRLTTFVNTVQGMRFACTGLADWCGKYSLFEGHLFGSNARIISKVARNRAWVAGGWRTSTSSRSGESVDREWEEIRIGWARVEKRASGRMSTHIVCPPKVHQFIRRKSLAPVTTSRRWDGTCAAHLRSEWSDAPILRVNR